jgi:excinuclease ABC subunit C
MVTVDAGEALMLESSLVRIRQPPFNVLLKDDSAHYPYLCITWSKPYPQFYVTSHKFISRKYLSNSSSSSHSDIGASNYGKDKPSWPTSDVYLGPFVEGNSLKRLLSLVKETFPLRQRWYPLYPDRTCLNYDIGRCPGVCQGLISPEQYRDTVGEAQMVFEGRSSLILSKLETRLNHAVATEAFELADTLHNQVCMSLSFSLSLSLSLFGF